MAINVIRRRDAQASALSTAGTLVALGLGCYLVAVVLAALTVGGFTPPPA